MRQGLLIGAGLLALGALVGLVGPVSARIAGRHRLRFPYLTDKLSAADYTELASRAGWQKSQLEVAPGISLRGLIRRPSDASAPWVLYYPGNDRTQLRTGQAFLARLSADRDWGLAVFAYRGYDASDGRPAPELLAADALVIRDAVMKQERVSKERLHLVGFSLGGFCAASAAGGSALGSPSKSLTLLASVNDITMFVRSPWQRFSPGDEYDVQPLLESIAGPVLVLQGAADGTFGGTSQAQAIFTVLGARAEYQEYVGVDHEALLAHDPAVARARAFISGE